VGRGGFAGGRTTISAALPAVREPDGSKHDRHDIDEARDGCPRQVNLARLEAVVERAKGYQHRPENLEIDYPDRLSRGSSSRSSSEALSKPDWPGDANDAPMR
jgi:hypothetical protein